MNPILDHAIQGALWTLLFYISYRILRYFFPRKRPPLCVDCIYFKARRNAECASPKNMDRRIVQYIMNSIPDTIWDARWLVCWKMRQDGPVMSRLKGTCGREGRWFSQYTKEKRAAFDKGSSVKI